jgi:hypothetical protein
VTYPSGSVLLTTTAPFTTAAAAPFSPHQDIPTGPVAVATIGSAANGTGTYLATVNWGDGSAVSTATVAVSGATGTVTAPTHTYATTGPFTVTTTVSNTDGTSLVTTQSVSVPVLAITAISPTSGPVAGGNTVTVTGTGFTGATQVVFGTVAATGVTVVNDDTLTAIAPAQSSQRTAAIRVTTPGGTSPLVPADQYAYILPNITGLSPNSGPTAGGTTVTITGTNFQGATKVTFGPTAGTHLTVVNSTTLTVVSPAEGAHVAGVEVTTPNGTSPVVTADQFTYLFPAVTGVSPATGPTVGGNTVTITGTDFTGATKVTFGQVAGTNLTVVNDTTLTVTAPAESLRTTDIRVTTADGTSVANPGDEYTYTIPAVTGIAPSSGPTAGGTTVTITGTSLEGATKVTFGQVAGTDLTVVNATTLTVVSPPQTARTVPIRVTSPNGTSVATAADQFSYIVPAITSLSPTTGPTSGGTTVTITGTHFTGATQVVFGTVAGTHLTVVNDTTITVVSPAETGVRSIHVTTPNGTSVQTPADNYTYTSGA